jgi:NADH dehydrogenase
VFGPEDAFLNTFASMQRMFPVIPLACPDAKFQPVFVNDVSKAIVNSVDLDRAIGKTYELGGPGVYTLEQLVRFAGSTIGRSARIIRLPAALARLQALGFEFLPGKPVLTRDNLDSMSVDNVTSAPIAPELDIEPASIETMAPIYLGAKREARSKAFQSGAHR